MAQAKPKRKKSKEKYAAVGGSSFLVSIGSLEMSFSKISNLSSAPEYETVKEGGVNDYVHALTGPQQKQETIIFERGVTNRGKDKLAEAGIKPGGKLNKPVTIMVLEDPGGKKAKLIKAYCFDEGVVTKWEIGDLDAMGSQVLIERFEIAHSGLKEIKL